MEIETLAITAGNLLKKYGQSVAVAESSAGGLISAALLAVPGASVYFKGGGVVYTSEAKKILMGLSEEEMGAARAATEDHALYLAGSAWRRLGADWGLGETGAAGPTGNRYGDPPGHTCLAIAGPFSRAITLATEQNDRAANMTAFAVAALSLLNTCIEQANNR